MNELVERQLFPSEIRQRQVDHLRLLNEIDNSQSEIEEHQRCVKESRAEIERLQARERELRRELRSGTVWETRQQKMPFQGVAATVIDHGISATTDDPDPETDPTEHDKPELLDIDDAFGKFFGRATDHEQLHADLACVLQNKGGAPSKEALIEAIGAVASTCFDEAAHWTRMQLAEMNRSEYPEFEVYLPKTPQPMPRALQAALKASKPKKPRAPRRPKGVDLPLNG